MKINNNYAIEKNKGKTLEEIMLPGEMCMTSSGKLFICVGNKDVKELNFNEQVTKEKADELIQAINLFRQGR